MQVDLAQCFRATLLEGLNGHRPKSQETLVTPAWQETLNSLNSRQVRAHTVTLTRKNGNQALCEPSNAFFLKGKYVYTEKATSHQQSKHQDGSCLQTWACL